jgi:hypothetical protein
VGGWQLPVPLEVLLLKLWQRWAVEVGFRWMKSGFGLGEEPCWGFDSGERSVERVGVWGVGVEWLLCVGWVDGWCALGFWLSESLRGVFTPARNGRLQTPTPRVGAC